MRSSSSSGRDAAGVSAGAGGVGVSWWIMAGWRARDNTRTPTIDQLVSSSPARRRGRAGVQRRGTAAGARPSRHAPGRAGASTHELQERAADGRAVGDRVDHPVVVRVDADFDECSTDAAIRIEERQLAHIQGEADLDVDLLFAAGEGQDTIDGPRDAAAHAGRTERT